MADLISKQALKEDLLKRGFYPVIVKCALQDAPVVDAVEVVRCEDCKHFNCDIYDFLGECTNQRIARNNNGDIYPQRDFFCAYGERKEND
jgi:hypothetical protein